MHPECHNFLLSLVAYDVDSDIIIESNITQNDYASYGTGVYVYELTPKRRDIVNCFIYPVV
jgi:hypothetical protein